MTIFGEENFFNKEMAKLYKAQDEYIYNEMSMAIKTYMPTVVFDREKLERWVRLCVKLDNIDNTELIDIATAKKFKELKDQLSLTEKALELACFYYHHDSCSNCDCDENCSSCTNRTAETLLESIKKEAKEMMKSE